MRHSSIIRKPLGWHPDLPDHRDHYFTAKRGLSLPSSVNLRNKFMPAVYDQGDLGSCTANAISAAIAFERAKQGLDKGVPQAFSRLFIYYNERAIEGTIDQDAGAEIRDGVKACAKLGVALEADWPYYTVQFKKRPALNVFNDALTRQITSYQRVDQKLTAMQNCLAQGFPFVFGFTVYESFTDQRCDQTGILNMPKPNEKMDGGHAVLCVGYNNRTKRFLVRNSWGANWGQKGYFTMPYDYLLNSDLASDFWTIRLSETSNGTNR